MRVFWKAISAGSMLGLFATASASAQHYRWDFGLNFGWGITSSVLDDNDDAFNGGALGFDNNWQYGAQLGYWFSRGFGVRTNFSYTSSPFMQGDGATLIDDVNLWSGTADLLIRFVKPRERWSGAELLPYAALGIGAHWVNPPGDVYVMADEIEIDDDGGEIEVKGVSGVPISCRLGACFAPSTPGFPGLGGAPILGTRTLFLEEGSGFSGLIGLGVDVRLAPSFAVRVEFGDLIWEAPLSEVEQRENFFSSVLALGDIGSTVHQFYGTLGAHVLFGLRSPQRVVVLPAPEPAPPPPPPPPPPPTYEDVTVCVVDPTTRDGLRMITARRHLSTGDTLVLVNDRPVKLSEASAGIPVASTANWYVRGAPLEIGRTANRILFVTTGNVRQIEPQHLAFVGTVDGLPVYVERSRLPQPLELLATGTDLSHAVTESKDAYNAVDSISTLYVPLHATGCVFQALDKQVNVRK